MADVSSLAAELLELLVIIVGAGAASAIGIGLERFGFEAAVGGDLLLGLWAAGMGLLALYVGIVALGYEQALPRLRRLAAGE